MSSHRVLYIPADCNRPISMQEVGADVNGVRALIGGTFELALTLANEVDVYGHGESRLLDLPTNARANALLSGELVDFENGRGYLLGDVVIAGRSPDGADDVLPADFLEFAQHKFAIDRLPGLMFPVSSEARGVVRPPASEIAEVITHKALLTADPSACHRGGNIRVRDHELWDNTVWVNTKTGWHDRPDRLGFSPVSAKSVIGTPDNRNDVLDLVSVIVVRDSDIRTELHNNSITYTWPNDVEWYLFPAKILLAAPSHRDESRARQSVAQEFANRYRIADDRLVTAEHIRSLCVENRQQPSD